MTTKNQKFLELMKKIQEKPSQEVIALLSEFVDKNGTVSCPVPGCESKTTYKRWGDMRAHFLDETTHKRDYFNWFLESEKTPFCDTRGAGFNHGLNSLLLALLTQPTPIPQPSQKKPQNVSIRPKKVKPIQEQRELAALISTGQKAVGEVLEPVAPEVPAVIEPPRLMGPSPSDFSKGIEDFVANKKQSFSILSEYIRQSDEINKVWRVKLLEKYVDMFHGIPPCFHCRVEEGKQIHHQNPLFHEIVLISLNKLGTTAEKVLDEQYKGNEAPLQSVLQDVFKYHMEEGKVCAVPYCQGCNQDAENKRKRGKRAEA